MMPHSPSTGPASRIQRGLPLLAGAKGHRLAGQPRSSPAFPGGLTEREIEVLRLLAQGHSDGQIAGVLVISPRTVNAHLRSIYSKLGITSRHAATLFALKQQLI
jgi:DNA-binding NarL/FixJ family response regulator